MSFPNLFTPRAVVTGGEPRYSMSLLFDPDAMKTDQYQAIKAEVIKCAQAAFGQNVNLQAIHLPIRQCVEKEQYGFMPEGSVFINPWSKQRPDILNKHKMSVDIPDDIWAGQTARCAVRCFSYNTSGKRGVSLGLGHVQMIDMNRDRLDGRKSAHDLFDEIDGPGDDGAANGAAGGAADTAAKGADLPF